MDSDSTCKDVDDCPASPNPIKLLGRGSGRMQWRSDHDLGVCRGLPISKKPHCVRVYLAAECAKNSRAILLKETMRQYEIVV